MDWTVETPQRLDAFLAEQAEGISRARAQKLIKDGAVQVNDAVVTKPAHALQADDRVMCDIDADQPTASHAIDPHDLHLEVLYEDDACLVINKPAGYAVHPGHSMQPDEVTILHGLAHLFTERGVPFSSEAVLVHRLDKETTGCLLVAKTAAAHEDLQRQFSDRTVEKQYLALVAGVPEHKSATIDAPIGRNLTDRTKMSVLKTSVSREAKTTYTVLNANADASLLQCDLHTGRTHQVRVHLRSIGHPILGDATYSTAASEELTKELHVEGLCLHAWRLSFTSLPGDSVTVSAPLPDVFVRLLERLGWDQVRSM